MWKIIKRRLDGDSVFVFFFVSMFAILFIAILFIPCEKNTDPRKGSVWISDSGVTKVCDGTTLVYDGEGTQLIPNSPECM